MQLSAEIFHKNVMFFFKIKTKVMQKGETAKCLLSH